jgi:6-phosphogluconate dehydrogenase
VQSLQGFREQLTPPRAIFIYIPPAGPGVDTILDAISPMLQEGDVLVDGGNSY